MPAGKLDFCSGLVSISLLIYCSYNLYVVRNHKAVFMRGQIIPPASDGFKSHLHSIWGRTKSGSHFKTIWFFITCTKFLIDRSLPAKMNLLLLLRLFSIVAQMSAVRLVAKPVPASMQFHPYRSAAPVFPDRTPLLPGIFQLIFFSSFIHNFDTTDCS